MAVRIQLRRDTAANWVSANPVLRAGEIGIETDTLKFKIGTGATWTNTTAYANVTPTNLSNSLSSYILTADQGNPGGPAELDSNGDLIIPENSIILWNDADYTYSTTVTATQPTADRTITLPDATTTLVGTDTTDTLTNKTLTSPVISGLTLSDSSIVFEGTVADSYETTLTVGEPTADNTITLPDRSGTVITTGDTGTVTNTMLAGSIANNKLANPSVTINGTSTSLGGTRTLYTDDITEDGSPSNLWFTNERAQDAVGEAVGTGLAYNDTTGAISTSNIPNNSLQNSSITINSFPISLGGSATFGTDNIGEGTTNLYFTDERAQDAVATALSNGTHTNITVSYNDGSNAISLTGAQTYSDENAQDAVGNAVGNGLDYDDNTGAISVDPSEFALSAVGAPTANIDFATYKITNLGAPTTANDAATKSYVDNITAGLNFHAAVHAATTANLDATYSNGTSGVGATLTNAGTNAALSIDGHSLSQDERVLVKNQTTGSQNGIYTVTTVGDGSTPWVLTRATDADNSPAGEIAYGDFTFVQNGSTNAGFGYIVNTTGTITIGTTSISYVQFNAGQVVVAGNGLTETTPGTLAINTAVTVDLNTAQTLTNKTLTSPVFTTPTLGTPSSGTLTNATGLPVSTGISGLGTGIATFLATPSSSNLASAVTDETGSGALVFGTSPTISSPTITGSGAIAGTFTGNLTGNVTGDVSGNAGTVTNGVYTNAANTITAASASTKPLIIKAASSQTATLQEWQNSSGTAFMAITSSGSIDMSYNSDSIIYGGTNGRTRFRYFENPTNTGAYLDYGAISGTASIIQRTTTAVGLIIKGAASQTANLQEWQDSSGTVLNSINSAGNMILGNQYISHTAASAYARLQLLDGGTNQTILYPASSGMIVQNLGVTGMIVFKIKGASGQTANLQEWQNSSGTVLMAVNSSGVISTGTWNGTAIGATYGGTGLTSYTTGDVLYASASNTLAKLAAGTNGYLLTMVGGVPAWAAAPISLPSQTGNSGKYLTTDGTTASWGTLVVPITTATATVSANTATTVDTTALSGFTSVEYMVSLKQGSKVRTSKVVLQTDGTSVDMTEFAITETGGSMTGIVVSATTVSTDAALQVTVTDAASTNVTVKLSKVAL